MSLLEVSNLNISLNGQNIISDINFSLSEGEIFGIVGQSGCGKSTLLKGVLGILPPEYTTAGGIFYKNEDLQTISPQKMRRIRGGQIGMIFQNAKTSLCPVRTIGEQIWETVREHQDCTKKDVLALTLDLFAKIRLQNGEKILQSYPFELSGGMNQRVGIMMAMVMKPDLLLADEPTSALDVTVQAQVVREMVKMRESYGTGIAVVTHNLGVVEYMADKIAVMHRGRLVEYGEKEEVIRRPQAEYTKKLLGAVLRLKRG